MGRSDETASDLRVPELWLRVLPRTVDAWAMTDDLALDLLELDAVLAELRPRLSATEDALLAVAQRDFADAVATAKTAAELIRAALLGGRLNGMMEMVAHR